MYQLAQWMLWWMQAQDINIFYIVSLKLFFCQMRKTFPCDLTEITIQQISKTH